MHFLGLGHCNSLLPVQVLGIQEVQAGERLHLLERPEDKEEVRAVADGPGIELLQEEEVRVPIQDGVGRRGGGGGVPPINAAVDEFRQHHESDAERIGIGCDDDARVGSQRVCVHCRDEQRTGVRVRVGNLAERPRAQRRPQARSDEIVADGLTIEAFEFARAVAFEFDRVVALELDHDRLQYAPLPAVDCGNGAAAR